MTRGLRRSNRQRRRIRPAAIAAGLLVLLAVAGCSSGNRRVRVGGSVHMTSGGSWGHSLSIGIQSHGGRR